jgi:hypothetical protein
VYGRLRNGFYGLEVMLVVLVFMALLREARAEGATRIPPAALGRVLGLDRAPEVKTIRRKLGELAAAGKAADLQMALARHHAAASPDALGFLYIDGHTRAYFGKRDIQKMHVIDFTDRRESQMASDLRYYVAYMFAAERLGHFRRMPIQELVPRSGRRNR